jgi:hypothetical protein
MGFNKRIFSKEDIKVNAQANEYETFKKYMTNSDAYIFEDLISNDIWKTFVNGNDETRRKIYKQLRNEA